MAPFFSLVKQLCPSTTLWVMKVRLVRFYEVPAFGNRSEIASFEYIFEDREGDRVHASVRGQTTKFFEGKAQEGNLYVVKDFIVTENRMKFRTTSHEMKIIFLRKTKMEEIFDDKFPATSYQLKSFGDIENSNEISEFLLFDVIGRVASCNLPPVTTARGKRMEFTLENCEKQIVKCTVWDEYIDKLLPFVESDSEDSIIVLIEFGRVSKFGDQIRFCNTYNVTKITVNGQKDPFQSFNKRLLESGILGAAVTTIESYSAPTIADAFKSGEADVKNLAEIVRCENAGYYWVAATIIQVETLSEWCYLACTKCSKKLTKEGGYFLCVKCGIKDTRGVYRYKIEVLLNDESGVAKAMLWDSECIELIQKSATDMMKDNPEAFDFLPKQVEESLNNRVGIFKIQVKETDHTRYLVTYNVTKVTADAKILSIFYDTYGEKKPSKNTLLLEEADSEEKQNEKDLEKGYEADIDEEEDQDDILLNKLVKEDVGDSGEAKKKKKKGKEGI